MSFESHPTVRRVAGRIADTPAILEGAWLRHLATECGADDVGVIDLARPALDPQRDEILANYPWTRSLLSFVVRMARSPVRGAPRSVANLEFHRAGKHVNDISAAIVARLEARGVPAVNPSMAFPMEMYRVGGGVAWLVSHKPIAVEAGLGHMGIHRNLIHPTFGNFVLLGTVLVARSSRGFPATRSAFRAPGRAASQWTSRRSHRGFGRRWRAISGTTPRPEGSGGWA
jgi:hypothetical protein